VLSVLTFYHHTILPQNHQKNVRILTILGTLI
jgi:hypothetical protein